MLFSEIKEGIPCCDSTEICAAIAAVLHAYSTDNNEHDIENTVLTINRTANQYSPWNSKYLSMRQTPNR